MEFLSFMVAFAMAFIFANLFGHLFQNRGKSVVRFLAGVLAIALLAYGLAPDLSHAHIYFGFAAFGFALRCAMEFVLTYHPEHKEKMVAGKSHDAPSSAKAQRLFDRTI